MELYGVKLQDSETRPIDLIWREAYLDMYSQSLRGQTNKGSHFAKKMKEFQKTHNDLLDKIIRQDSVAGLDKDPLLEAESEEPDYKVSIDGVLLEKINAPLGKQDQH